MKVILHLARLMFDFDIQTTLSYAAIFGIVDDLKLHGTQYNWLSSIFYFGFLVWAFPTNFLLQRLPIGMCSIQTCRRIGL